MALLRGIRHGWTITFNLGGQLIARAFQLPWLRLQSAKLIMENCRM